MPSIGQHNKPHDTRKGTIVNKNESEKAPSIARFTPKRMTNKATKYRMNRKGINLLMNSAIERPQVKIDDEEIKVGRFVPGTSSTLQHSTSLTTRQIRKRVLHIVTVLQYSVIKTPAHFDHTRFTTHKT